MTRAVVVAAMLLASVASAKPTPAPAPKPSHVEKVDALSLELATERLMRAERELADAQRFAAEQRAERERLVADIAKRYQLDPGRDHFDPATLEIQRAANK